MGDLELLARQREQGPLLTSSLPALPRLTTTSRATIATLTQNPGQADGAAPDLHTPHKAAQALAG